MSNWSKDSSKLKFRVISSDDMDSNDLWAQRNDSTSSLFWKSDYKTTAKKVIRHFFCLLIESSGPWIWKHWVSKCQSGRSEPELLVPRRLRKWDLIIVSWSLYWWWNTVWKIWRLFHCENVKNAEFHFHRDEIFISLGFKCSNFIPSYHRHYQIDSPIYDIWDECATCISLRMYFFTMYFFTYRTYSL